MPKRSRATCDALMRLYVGLVPVIALCTGCVYTQYIAQAAHGQLDLLARAEPIDRVIRDPQTPLRTALLLAEIPAIKSYGRSYGLRVGPNYDSYTELPRPAAVWFVGAADPVAFRPRKWCFPIAGCFTGLGWFDEDDAVRAKLALEAQGYDAIVRPAVAYSTGGWFPDPVLSSMLSTGDDALPQLVNVILHESVHATVLIADEPFFNESFASYVADSLTNHWIDTRFGPGSPEELSWTIGQAFQYTRALRFQAAYQLLQKIYNSKRARADKLVEKAKIIDELVADLRLHRRPNNASLTESRAYHGGLASMVTAHRDCGDLTALIAAAKTLDRSDFQRDLQDDLAPIGKLLGTRCSRMQKSGSPRRQPG